MKMACSTALNMASLIKFTPLSSPNCNSNGEINYGFHVKGAKSLPKLSALSPNGSISRSCSKGASSSAGDVHRRRSSLESLFCYDKAIPEERIEKPVGISLAEKLIGDNPDAMIARPKEPSFAPLALVQACMLTQYWKARGLLSKSGA